LAGKALHADNLERFEALVAAKLNDQQNEARRLPGLLRDWCAAFEISDPD
jgi:hypothetical protein